MNNTKFMITFCILLLTLPIVSAQVKIGVGEPYVNIEDFSEIEFRVHSDYYEICSLDETVIPVLIKNENKFPDTFRFEVDKEYASLPVKSAVLKSGKGAILPLIVSPPVELEENTTLILDVITKKEALKRSVIIKTNIKRCYLFDIEIDKDKDEICGCDRGIYSVVLDNKGRYVDTFTLNLDIPGWVNSTLKNETIELDGGKEEEVRLEASPSCEEKGVFSVNAKVISEKSKVVLEDSLEISVLPEKECYNTVISADNVGIDYFGRNIPITIKNKGVKDATYSLSVEGIDWYVLSQTDFSIKKNEEKTINLALSPDEGVVEGRYNIDIKAEADGREFTESITVKLKSKGVFFERIKFYLNYFRYYIGLGVVVLIIILLSMVFVKKRVKEKKVKPKKEKVEEEVKKVEKKIVKRVKKIKIGWLLPFVLYLIFLGLLVLLTYSTFKYRAYYEKVLNFISGLFTKCAVPYLPYLRYVVLGAGVVLIVLLVIDFLRKKPKKKKKEKKEEIKKKEEPKEKKIEVKKVGKKVVKKRKLKLFEYIYLVLVVLLFLAIIVYAVYRFSGKTISCSKCVLVKDFVKGYYSYFIIGIIILVLLVAVINFVKKIEKKSKKVKKEKKIVKKVSKKLKLKRETKRFIRNLVIVIIGLVVLSGIIYSFVYYNLIIYIKDFFVVYYPYILMGMGILIILILILHFQSKKIA